ncbi:hypothetical protein PINS_up008937 [Pythium insidiosum]|nr:hypothetical protein PINS_up008937 [Pythium insidiosum]
MASSVQPLATSSASPRALDAAMRRRSVGHRATRRAERQDSGDDAADDEDYDDEDDDDEEVTTEVFEVELGHDGSATLHSPWSTAFLECASEGDLSTLSSLLDDGKVDVNDVDVDGFTALMIASAEGRTAVALELLRRGADVSIRTHELRSTALHFAAKSGVAEVVDAICKQDPTRIDVHNYDGDTPLVWACTEGRADAVRVLLQHKADVNALSHRAMSTLICAVMLRDEDEKNQAARDEERAEILRLLLAQNPKLVNYQDRDGSTAMHLAACHSYLACVKALLDGGADLTLRNAIGQTAIEEALDAGVSETDACMLFLRTIWKRLEDEAAARMMAMLEMEEELSSSNNAAQTKGKKTKKKQKKAKRKTPSTTTTTATSVSTASASTSAKRQHKC